MMQLSSEQNPELQASLQELSRKMLDMTPGTLSDPNGRLLDDAMVFNDIILTFGFIGPFLLAWIGSVGLRAGSWEKAGSVSSARFALPTGLRLISLLLSGYLMILMVSVIDVEFGMQIWRSRPLWLPTIGLNLLATLLCFGLLWSLPARKDIVFDLKLRHYRYDAGSILHRTIRTGTWGDIDGVYVRQVKTRNFQGCIVGVAWAHTRRDYPTLGIFRRHAEAADFAERVSERLGLPMITAPTLEYDKGRGGRS